MAKSIQKIPFQRVQCAMMCLCPNWLLYHAQLWGTQTQESLCPTGTRRPTKESVTHSSQSPPLKSTTGKLPVSLTAAPQQLQMRQDPHARDTQTAKDSTCLRASLTDRRATGRERSGAAIAHPGAQSWHWLSNPRLLRCSLPAHWNKPPSRQQHRNTR